MTGRNFLGEFEHMVLVAVLQLDGEAYGAAIVREIESRTGRGVPSGSLYVTLDRLENKGLVRSRIGEPDARRGGRPKRFVTVTTEGMQAVREVRQAMLSLWKGLEARLEEKKV